MQILEHSFKLYVFKLGEAEHMGETKICLNCQRNNQMESIFCWYCNADIRNDYFQQGGSGNDDWISPVVWVIVVVLAILVFATLITPGVVPPTSQESTVPAKYSLQVTHWNWEVKSDRLSALSFDVENRSASTIENLHGSVILRDETDQTLKTIRFNLKPQPFAPGSNFSFGKSFKSVKRLTEPKLFLYANKEEPVSFTMSYEPQK